ncbi:(2Fe-2S)-binding protein [Rhodococcus sp. ACS1]|nr:MULTISPECIES: Rieske (2Fe-2S) protein [unclassified Rhodococcus (in: high G+C Gram-positive bacteria)]PBC39112.1 (2Fe-2S)-binding protein [Rhodococcus sp. ACS1]PBC47331.1 (2Fe-2S)-binding protein [Rhodococcus sp. ACPA1]
MQSDEPNQEQSLRSDQIALSRRTVVAGIGAAAAALAAGSALFGRTRASAAPGPSAGPAVKPAGAPVKTGSVPVGNVPVGGGAVLGDAVVTQPSGGDFRGFSSTCTHAGCTVSDVSGGTINCPCHGSKFNLDGSVHTGPASAPLAPRSVSVQGDSVVVG